MTIDTEVRLAAITRDRVRDYGDAVGDHNPVHFDEEFAKATGLPTTVVHGPLTVTLILDALVAELGTSSLLNLDVRLRAPVFPGDVLTVRGAAYGVAVENDRGVLVATGVVITNEEP